MDDEGGNVVKSFYMGRIRRLRETVVDDGTI